MNRKNQLFVKKVIDNIKGEREGFFNHEEHSWITIGSYVTNSQNDKSDVDLLYIYNGEGTIERIKKEYYGVPISLCTVPLKYIVDDGKKRLYGGYFSIKCLNPHFAFDSNEKVEKLAFKSGAEFLGPLASYISTLTGKDKFTEEEITAHCFIAFISMRAGYISYFLSYYILDNFKDVWKSLISKVIDALIDAKVIEQIGDKSYSYNKKLLIKDYITYHFERMKADSRHWSYGALLHNNDFTFQDSFYNNADIKLKRIDPKGIKIVEMVEFLKLITGLQTIII